MKTKASFLLVILISLFVSQSLFAADNTVKVPRKYQINSYIKAVEKELGHKTQDYEKSIINTTYSYYSSQCENQWDKESWKEAVDKAAELCRNKIAIAAAKAGEFGEKLLKALIISTKDAAESVSNWLDKKSQEYDDLQKQKPKNESPKNQAPKKDSQKKDSNKPGKTTII